MKRAVIIWFGLSLCLLNLSNAAIYGNDDRRDIFQVPWLKPLAISVADAVPTNFFLPNGDGTFRVDDVEKLAGSSTVNACRNERFANQTTIGNCTGFVIGDRYLVTAGHCVVATGIVDNDSASPFCAAFSWYFDYNTDMAGRTNDQKIPANRIYGCKRMIRAENIELQGLPTGANYGNDFAVMELDPPIAKDIIPLVTEGRRDLLKTSASVFTIGHPSGLPAKYSGTGPIVDISNEYHFETYLDTLGGNSGSPVFNSKKEVVGILVSGHPVDYYHDAKNNCARVNRCNSDGTKCNESSQFTWLQKTNSVQYIDTVLRFVSNP